MTNQSSSYVRELGKNDHTDIDSLVHNMNADKVRLFIPVVVFVSLMMVLGLLGNAFVCYFYTFKEKKSTNTFFIVVLSVYDLLTCLFIVPAEIAILTLYYTFGDDIACKSMRFMNFFLTIASILTLIAIATDRYKRICHVIRPQIEMHQARGISVIVVMFSILTAMPSLFLYGSNHVPIAYNSTLEVNVQKCTRTKDVAYRVYISTYVATQFFFFVASLAVLIILYSIIGHTIYHHRKRLKSQFKMNHKGRELKYSNPKRVTSSLFTIAKEPTKEEGIRSDAPVDQIVGNDDGVQHEPNMLSHSNTETSKQLSDVIDETNNVNPNEVKNQVPYKAKPSIIKDSRRNHQFDAESVRVTLVMVIVTVVFIGSFIPYISLAVWNVITGRDGSLFLSDASLVAFEIGFRSYLLNSSLNPWIYGIFNSQFRRFYFGWCFRKRG